MITPEIFRSVSIATSVSCTASNLKLTDRRITVWLMILQFESTLNPFSGLQADASYGGSVAVV